MGVHCKGIGGSSVGPNIFVDYFIISTNNCCTIINIFACRFLTDKGEQGRFMEVVGLFFFFFLGNWIINKLERYLSYAVRRFASLCLTTFVVVTTIYLVTLHTQYIRYTVAVYYFLSSISFLFLVMGYHNQINFVYKLHDYIVGHSIFLLLIICASLQLGYFQTWLLYYDALSAGVEMKDILKYARRSKERSTDETETINDLKLQVQKQEKLIREMMGKTSDASEKSSLLPNNYSSDYKGGSFGYGSVPAKEGSNIIIINPLSTAAATSATSRVVHPADGGENISNLKILYIVLCILVRGRTC